jgi:hypothetical protein
MKSIIVFVAIFLASVFVDAKINAINEAQQSKRRCWSSGNGKLAQFWDEGSRIDRGMFFKITLDTKVPMNFVTQK